jgi:DNA-binding NarL/FixJ family response regulator
MKVSICVAIDDNINATLNKLCKKEVSGIIYKRSKSDVVNEAVRAYLLKEGFVL